MNLKNKTTHSIMNPSEETFDEQQSLRTIRQMIDQSKRSLTANGFFYILWGWLAFVASIAQFILIEFGIYKWSAAVWSVVIIGIVVSVIKGRKLRSEAGATSYSGSIMGVIWIAFLINYFILVAFAFKINVLFAPIILVMIGGTLFTASYVIKFYPFLWGAIIVWLAAIACFLIPIEFQPLAMAGAMMFGYLVPGYMLRNREK